MSTWTIVCLVGTIIFGLLAAFFAIIKEKGAKFYPGYKTIPQNELDKYDKKQMSIEIRDEFATWAGILIIGVLLSAFIEVIYGIIAFFLWLIIFVVKLLSISKNNIDKHKKQ